MKADTMTQFRQSLSVSGQESGKATSGAPTMRGRLQLAGWLSLSVVGSGEGRVTIGLAPDAATMTTRDDPRRCWECAFYNFKVYGGENNSEGKCFGYRETNHRIYWVDGLMTCSRFKQNINGYET